MNFRNILAVCLLTLGAASASIPAYAAGDATKGATTVNTVCAACHGADGNSPIGMYPNLAGQHPEYINKQLLNFKAGDRKNAIMSGMAATLSPEDMQNVAAYFATQKPKPATAKTNGAGSVGEKIFKGGIPGAGVPACASCHGPAGAGIPVQFPRLAGQHSEYIVSQMKAWRSGERANDGAKMMRMVSAKLSDSDIEAVADYIQGLR